MNGPPLFQRSPRLLAEVPRGDREIPAPPPAPAPPTISLVSILLPASGSLLGLALMVAFTAGRGGSGALSYLGFSLPSMLALSVAVPIYNYLHQKKVHRQAVREREAAYRTLLQACQEEMGAQWEQQREILCEVDPDPAGCAQRALCRDARLWQRSPADPDFLSLRLGLGALPFFVKIKLPRIDLALQHDPLCEEARQMAAQLEMVSPVPIPLPLQEAGVAGLIGPRPQVIESVRSLILQIVTHHSPDEVKVSVLYPQEEAASWAWVRWFPHVWSDDRQVRFLADHKEDADRLLSVLHDYLQRRRLETGTKGGKEGRQLPCLVFVLADPRLAEGEAILPLLMAEGRNLGAYSLILTGRKESLPKECLAIVDLGPDEAQLIRTSPVLVQIPFTPDPAPLHTAELAARALAPVRLQRLSAADVPDSLTLLDLLGVSQVEEVGILAAWRSSQPDRTLAAPLGLRAGGEQVAVDLHEKGHGPHGLVAGATGSGKSELLQTLIVSIAARCHPHDVAFVVVDFKGGALANDFAELPHLVGTITNLQGNLAARALAAIRGEIRRRQAALSEAGFDSINDYLRARRRPEGRRLAPLPHLVIVVDEFAELKTEQPDFMRELVSAVRVGRSLGIHLILATQKPAGIVDEQIWSNSRFRICLRVERPEDSQEVLKRPEAATIRRPGRAYLQVGNNEKFELLQAAWGGAPYIPGGDTGDPNEIAEVKLSGARTSFTARRRAGPAACAKQLEALVSHIAAAARKAGIDRLPGPWLPPLPEQVSLEAIRPREGWNGRVWTPASTWMHPAAGLMDDPANQSQELFRANLGRDGHLLVYGAPGTGKTTLLQTLLLSLALTHSPDDLHLYVLDFGGRSLAAFSALPHAGGVILADEAERVGRLLQFLLREMEARKERFATAGANTLAAYRAGGGHPIPAVVVALDNYTGFASTYPDAEDQIAQIAREGGNLGIHLVITAYTPSTMRSKISGNIPHTVALSLTDRGEYALAMGRAGLLEPQHLPGRGLVRGTPPLEFQAALPAPGDTETERSAALRRLIRQMDAAWAGPRPAPVRVLPQSIRLSEVVAAWQAGAGSGPGRGATGHGGGALATAPLAVPVGLEADSLEPFAIDLTEGPHFLVSGPTQSGKSTALLTWARSLATIRPPEQLWLCLADFRGESFGPLSGLGHVRDFVTHEEPFRELIARLDLELQQRRERADELRRAPGAADTATHTTPRWPALVLLADDFDALLDGTQQSTRDNLEQLVKRSRGLGFHLVLAGSSSVLGSSWDGLVKTLKEYQTGILVGSSDHSDLQLFNMRLPPGETGRTLVPGLGYYIRRGRFTKIKIALPDPEDAALALAGRQAPSGPLVEEDGE